MFAVFKKEINAFLNSLVGYLVICIFLVGVGLCVWVFPQTSVLDAVFADLYPFFSLSPYVFLFLIPAITMRSLAEERKNGTLELLLTHPLQDWQIILGKYLACLVLVIFALLPTFLYYVSVWWLGAPQGNLDSAAVFGSYLGLALLGAAFAAIGLWTSSLTANQIVAFMLGCFVCFIFYYGFSAISGIDTWSSWAYVVAFFGLDTHYEALGKGLIDSRHVLYLLSLILAMLGLTALTMSSRKWST
ncbi:MAG: gliding motility-associated ABC transporter permease subunit GldF [Cytophagales bacterium]|nr:MAG: gliding motility-associated ABC transporter permease subunit GldF [Cytophagales bacterium]TAF61193.1 MAG: gliding motility-associated ABC transporter permease subunit GldF [Cytophagales bacterium]